MTRGVSLVLASVWLTTVLAACAAALPAMHCRGISMPCCPVNNSSRAQCSGAECIDAIPQKSEPRSVVAAQSQPATTEFEQLSQQPSPSPISELTQGLRFRSAVFRLKDDLRI